MRSSGKMVVLAVVTAVVFAALYWGCAPSLQHQHWDSLCYAAEAETSGIGHIQGNHPLPNIVWEFVMFLLRRGVLSRYGNMSSPSVLFVLQRLGRARRPLLMLGLGPGPTFEAALLT